MINVNEVEAVVTGGKFCECGGLMTALNEGMLLLSDPPKVKIECHLCGSVEYVLAPYNVRIDFKLKKIKR